MNYNRLLLVGVRLSPPARASKLSFLGHGIQRDNPVSQVVDQIFDGKLELGKIYSTDARGARQTIPAKTALGSKWNEAESSPAHELNLLILYILLQTPQPLLGSFQNIVVLAEREPQIVLRQMRVFRRVELRRRNGRNAHFHDQEPAQLEVSRATGHVGREFVVGRELDFCHVDEDEVAAFGVGVLWGFRQRMCNP